MWFASLRAPPGQVGPPGRMRAAAEEPHPAKASPKATTNFWPVWRPVLPAVTGSRDANPLPASFLKLMSRLTLASPPGKPPSEPCCSHRYKLLSFPA